MCVRVGADLNLKIHSEMHCSFSLLSIVALLYFCFLELNALTTIRNGMTDRSRRQLVIAAGGGLSFLCVPRDAVAYTPDDDPLRESLYLICRVQEATCLQERYIKKQSPPIRKMKLTLRLVDRSYRLLDQVNFVSKYMEDSDVVAAYQAGSEAVSSLQDAIDFVYGYYQQKDGDTMTTEQREFLLESLATTRERLFDFVGYLPDQTKLGQARARVEQENKLNVDEFDPDLVNDAGIFNPIQLPWKE